MCVNILDFEQNFRMYWAHIQAGRYIFLVQSHQIVAVISPLASSNAKRPCGLAKGLFSVPDDFDAALPQDMLNEFYK